MDTPEGGACGLTKSLAMLAHVRVGTFSTRFTSSSTCCSRRGLPGTRARARGDLGAARAGVPVLVNGALALYAESEALAARARRVARAAARRRHPLRHDDRDGRRPHLVVETDPGCLMRPLLARTRSTRLRSSCAARRAPRRSWTALRAAGAVEYVDKQEEAALPRGAERACAEPPEGWGAYTHCELEPSAIVGLCGAPSPLRTSTSRRGTRTSPR